MDVGAGKNDALSPNLQRALQIIANIRAEVRAKRGDVVLKKWSADSAAEVNPYRRAIADALRDYQAFSPQLMTSPDSAVQVLIGQAIAYGRQLEAAGVPGPRVIVGRQPEQRPLPGIVSAN